MGNGSSLHLGTISLKFLNQTSLDLFAGNKLVTADHAPGMNVNVRIDFSTGGDSDLGEMLVCNKFSASQLRNLTGFVTENSGIHIMMQRIPGDQDISDVQGSIQGTCHAGIDDSSNSEEVCQDLYTESGIDFADTAADDDNGSTV